MVKFNKDTATPLAHIWNSVLDSLDRIEETLYVQDGEYFLAGNGGPRTIYADKSKDGSLFKSGSKVFHVPSSKVRYWFLYNQKEADEFTVIDEEYCAQWAMTQEEKDNELFFLRVPDIFPDADI